MLPSAAAEADHREILARPPQAQHLGRRRPCPRARRPSRVALPTGSAGSGRGRARPRWPGRHPAGWPGRGGPRASGRRRGARAPGAAVRSAASPSPFSDRSASSGQRPREIGHEKRPYPVRRQPASGDGKKCQHGRWCAWRRVPGRRRSAASPAPTPIRKGPMPCARCPAVPRGILIPRRRAAGPPTGSFCSTSKRPAGQPAGLNANSMPGTTSQAALPVPSRGGRASAVSTAWTVSLGQSLGGVLLVVGDAVAMEVLDRGGAVAADLALLAQRPKQPDDHLVLAEQDDAAVAPVSRPTE